MSKYSHYEMCEKIFGSRYKFNERTGQMDVYTRNDMWDKLIEQQNQILELESKYKKAYQEGLLQKQFDKDVEIDQLKNQLKKTQIALSLAVADKCKFENACLKDILKVDEGKVLVPKKEQWYLEQASFKKKKGEKL